MTRFKSALAKKKPGAKPRGACLHCGGVKGLQARGLCMACWRKPHVRCRYEPIKQNRHPDDETPSQAGRTLPQPTKYPPGSEGKILELQRRLADGYLLWNPRDAQRDAR